MKPHAALSFREHLESRLSRLPVFENIDRLGRAGTGKRADYFLYDRRLVVEQKTYLETPQHKEKGKAIESLFTSLEKKYRKPFAEIIKQKPGILREEEADELNALSLRFNDKVKDLLHESSKQIGSTKRIFGIPEATGAVLLIFDRVTGVFPGSVSPRIHKCLSSPKSPDSFCGHIDFVISCFNLKDLSFDGGNVCYCHSSRITDGDMHISYARSILDVFKDPARSLRPRRSVTPDTISRYDQARPYLFLD